MIDKSQTANEVYQATNWRAGTRDCIDDPNVLIYVIGDCPTCLGAGWDVAGCIERGCDQDPDPIDSCPTCPDCDDGKERVRVIPETTLRRLVRRARWPYSASDYEEDLLIAQLIEELT